MKLIIRNLSQEMQFGVLFTIIFSILFIFILLKNNLLEINIFIVSIFFIMFTLFFPKIFYFPKKNLNKFRILLGKFITPIFLFVICCIFFVPIGVVYKIHPHDPLKRV